MANGSDTEEYVVLSRVRPGLKREFAFAWKSQADCAGAIGRTRARRSVNGGMANEVSRNPINKRLKSSDSKNAKNDAEECSSAEYKLVSDAENTTDNVAAKTKTSSDVVRDNAEVSVSVSEEEPKSGVVDLSSDDEQKSAFEPTSIELPAAEGQAQECDSGNEDGEQDESKPPCKGEEISGLGLNREPHDGVVERAFDEMPVKRVTLSADKVAVEPLLRSANVDIKNRQVLESSTVGELERKMPKQMELKRFPKFLKELLETGLLEGMPVRYLRGLKTRGPSDTGLRGIIKGSGILCSCDSCGGTQVVTPNQFELHAGSGNKRPPEYIYLDNGNTLRDVLNACKDAPLESLEVAICNVIGCSVENKLTFCMNCKGSIPKPGSGRTLLLCNSCMILTKSQPSPAPLSVNSERSPISVSVPKSSYSGSSSSPRSKTQGRLTRKDLRLHKLVFQNDVLPEGTKLGYFAHGKQILAGCKMGFGIYCECCKSEVSPSQFEAHAGWASRRKPYLHIYLSVGVSLHQLSVALAKLRKPSTAENDDLCSICADGGDLICCDCCPRAFHTECVSLASVPNDTWYCKYCLNLFRKEKFVKLNANAVAAGRISGINPLEQLIKRCTRIVETADPDIGGCALCRGHGFSKSEFGPQTVILCDQCEKEYHVGCLKEHEMGDLKELPEGKWFCCMDCSRIHSALETQVARGEENLQKSLLTVKKKLQEKGSDSRADVDIRWRLLSGKMVSDETRPLFLKAVAIFHEQFDPIADSNVRGDDLIPPMVYGRSVRDQEFGGMYCAVLSVNSNIVSAGIIRIFGEEVAELPLVATSSECQGQGYFQVLFSCIENLLISLNVRNLVLPAAGEAESLWTNKFGFKKITEDEMMKYRKDHPLMVFQGTSMLHKSVSQP